MYVRYMQATLQVYVGVRACVRPRVCPPHTLH